MALPALLAGLKSISAMGLKKAAVQGAKDFAKGKAKDFITGRGRKKKKTKRGKGGGGGTGDGDGGSIILRTGSTSIVPFTPMVPGALAVQPEDVEYTEPKRPVTLDSIANQLRSIVALTETLEKVVKKQYKGRKKASEKARVEVDKERKREREEKREGLNLGEKALGVGRKVANKFNIFNFLTQLVFGTIAVFLVKNIDAIIAAFNFVKENLSLVLLSIYNFSKGLELIKPTFLKAIKDGKKALSVVSKPFKDAFASVGKGIRNLFKAIGDLIPNIVKKTFSVLRGAAKAIASVPAKTLGALRFLNPLRSKEGAKATKSVIQRYTQRFGRSAAESKFGKKKVTSAVGKGVVGRTTDKVGRFAKRGATKVNVGLQRGAQKVGAKMFGPKVAKMMRIPVIGPLISVVASLLSGEPISQALFKGVGAALGGFLGTAIPIPVVGMFIGELIGEYVGDLMYTLLMGGGVGPVLEKLKKDISGVLSMGETAIKWAGDGMKRFYEGIPKWKIPDWVPGWMLGPVEALINLGGKSLKDIEIPSPLWMVNPFNIAQKVGTFYKAFFTRDPMIEGKVSDPKKKPDKDGKTTSQQQTPTDSTQPSVTTPKPDRSDPKYSGRSGAAKYQKDMEEWQSSQPTVTAQQQTTPVQPQTPVAEVPGVSAGPEPSVSASSPGTEVSISSEGMTPNQRGALDVLAKYESGAAGYDAVNQIGTQGGRGVKGFSGDIKNAPWNPDNRSLTDMTIGEIKQRQYDDRTMSDSQWIKSGKLHAVGRYQFIANTLPGVAERAGIPDDAKFTPEVQDILALQLMKERGISPWVGPSDKATSSERALVEAASKEALPSVINSEPKPEVQPTKIEPQEQKVPDQQLQPQTQDPQPTQQPQQQKVPGQPQQSQQQTSGAFNTGLRTGKSQYIGGSSEYHIDTKFKSSLSMEKKVQMMDQLAEGYAAQGRKIEFSNAAISGAVYDRNATYEEKAALLQKAFEAHNLPRGRAIDQGGFNSIDYYAPLAEENRFGKSVEGNEILIPTVGGTEVEYHQGGGYGAFVALTDENDEVLLKTGHGDIRGAKSGQVQLSDVQDQMVGAPQQPPSQQQQAQPQQQAIPKPKPKPTGPKPKREDFGQGRSGAKKFQEAMKKWLASQSTQAPTPSPSPAPSAPSPSPAPSSSAPSPSPSPSPSLAPLSTQGPSADPSSWSSVNPQQNMLQPSDMILDASEPGFGMISPPKPQSSAGIEKQASYDQPSEGGTTLLAPQPSQQPEMAPAGGGGGGGSVASPSTGALLNSYYKRQLLGFLYKQG